MEPYWSPFDPPKKSDGNWMQYPEDYDVGKAPENTWSENKFVLIISIKRYFDLMGVCNLYVDDNIY